MPSSEGRPGKSGKVLNPQQSNPLLMYEYERGSNYEADIGLTAALSALIPDDELLSGDHRFFQILHLMSEYAWVAIHHTLCDVDAALTADEPMTARRFLERSAGLAEIPLRCVRLLISSLPQAGLLYMRQLLPPNSTGLDSPGARNLRRACSALWTTFEMAIARRNVSLDDLTSAASLAYRGDEHIIALADVMVAMHKFDQLTLEWKQAHLHMVWMLLGGEPSVTHDSGSSANAANGGPRSLRGRPVSDLERMAARPMFPRLWQLSTDTFVRVVDDGAEIYGSAEETSR